LWPAKQKIAAARADHGIEIVDRRAVGRFEAQLVAGEAQGRSTAASVSSAPSSAGVTLGRRISAWASPTGSMGKAFAVNRAAAR